MTVYKLIKIITTTFDCDNRKDAIEISKKTTSTHGDLIPEESYISLLAFNPTSNSFMDTYSYRPEVIES